MEFDYTNLREFIKITSILLKDLPCSLVLARHSLGNAYQIKSLLRKRKLIRWLMVCQVEN